MFGHTAYPQFDAVPEKPDPVYARKLQELIGGAHGEMSVTVQYLFQGWNCRVPGKYKDLIMDVATKERVTSRCRPLGTERGIAGKIKNALS
jgi:Mn-containing catalase